MLVATEHLSLINTSYLFDLFPRFADYFLILIKNTDEILQFPDLETILSLDIVEIPEMIYFAIRILDIMSDTWSREDSATRG